MDNLIIRGYLILLYTFREIIAMPILEKHINLAEKVEKNLTLAKFSLVL